MYSLESPQPLSLRVTSVSIYLVVLLPMQLLPLLLFPDLGLDVLHRPPVHLLLHGHHSVRPFGSDPGDVVCDADEVLILVPVVALRHHLLPLAALGQLAPARLLLGRLRPGVLVGVPLLARPEACEFLLGGRGLLLPDD